MKKILLLLGILVGFLHLAKAQFLVKPNVKDSFSLNYLKQFAYPLEIKNDALCGEGWEVLKASLSHAQFMVLGEYHGSSTTAHFTRAILPELRKKDFNHFAVEVGPHSASILEEMATPPSATLENLHQFYSKYFIKKDYDIPIPFFDGVEDAAFLAEAKKQGYDLWGLDQEYYSSAIMLGDRLLDLKKGTPKYGEIKAAKLAYDSTFLAAHTRDASHEEGFRMFKVLLESPEVNHYFSFFESDSTGQAIIQALKKSWDIYDRNDYRGGYSHGHRIAYMRQNFLKNYQSATEDLPKVFIKTGAFHAGKSYAGSVYDVGNLAYELAQVNGTNCINIRCQYRYYEEDAKVTDESENAYISAQKTFQQLGRKDEYVLVDLRPIARQMKALKLKLPNDVGFHHLKYMVENFDFLLLNPLDREVVLNYEKGKQ